MHEQIEELFDTLKNSRKYVLKCYQDANRALMSSGIVDKQRHRETKEDTGKLLNEIDAILRDADI